MESESIQLGINMYSVDHFARTDLNAAIKEVKDIGYNAVEITSYYSFEPREIRKLVKRQGLIIPSVHANIKFDEPKIVTSFEDLAKTVVELGSKYIVVPWFPIREGLGNYEFEFLEKTLEDFVNIAERYKLTLVLHNDSREFNHVEPENRQRNKQKKQETSEKKKQEKDQQNTDKEQSQEKNQSESQDQGQSQRKDQAQDQGQGQTQGQLQGRSQDKGTSGQFDSLESSNKNGQFGTGKQAVGQVGNQTNGRFGSLSGGQGQAGNQSGSGSQQQQEVSYVIDRLLEPYEVSQLQLELDFQTLFMSGLDPFDVYRRYQDRVAFVHLRNVTKGRKECLLEDGVIDYTNKLKHLTNIQSKVLYIEQQSGSENQLENAKKNYQFINELLQQISQQ